MLAASLALWRPASATTAADLCPPTADPCIVIRAITVDPDSLLDVGGRALELGRGGALTVGEGTMTVRARSLRLAPGAALLGRGTRRGGTIDVATTGGITLEASGNTRARIDVSGATLGGEIRLAVGGDTTLGGILDARADSAEGDGGSISVTAAGNLIAGETTVAGGGGGSGGAITLAAGGRLLIGGRLDASGGSGDGGSITLEAAADLATSAELDVSARVGEGDAGSVTLTAGGGIALRGPVSGRSACDDADGCTTIGGELIAEAGQGVVVGAQVALSGAGPDGEGGVVNLKAAGDIVQQSPLLADGKGTEGCGGGVTLVAGRDLVLGAIEVGGACGGGAVSATAGGTASVTAKVDADGRGQGFGGDITVGGRRIVVSGSLLASAAGAPAGSVTLAGCDLEVATGARLATTGNGGKNLLQASGQILIEGVLDSGTGRTGQGGINELRFRDASTPPQLTARANLTPAPQLVHDPALPPCGGTPTPVCGNGGLEANEGCDDGNLVACDGCSPTCENESCGNGRLECAEACDDSNLAACDGCSPTCLLEGCGNGRLECSEECDEGPANGTPGATCDATCRLIAAADCGNGVPDPEEACDDGNLTPCDGCSEMCRLEACGNGTAECAEACDDFNTRACDGCSATCRVEECGNGRVECSETCDDGSANGLPGASCDTTCHPAVVCGLSASEVCVPCARDTDCDPLGPCGGRVCDPAGSCIEVSVPDCRDGDPNTADVCVVDGAGGPTCEHACINAAACTDGNLCNGEEVCLDGRCLAGTGLVCDDGDLCTDAGCDPALGCSYSPKVGMAGIGCRLDTIAAAIADPAAGDLAPATQRRLRIRLAHLGTLAASAGATGSTRREKRILGRIDRQLGSLRGFIVRAERRGRIKPALADILSRAVAGARDATALVRGSLPPR